MLNLSYYFNFNWLSYKGISVNIDYQLESKNENRVNLTNKDYSMVYFYPKTRLFTHEDVFLFIKKWSTFLVQLLQILPFTILFHLGLHFFGQVIVFNLLRFFPPQTHLFFIKPLVTIHLFQSMKNIRPQNNHRCKFAEVFLANMDQLFFYHFFAGA